jgi:hypothetical protein
MNWLRSSCPRIVLALKALAKIFAPTMCRYPSPGSASVSREGYTSSGMSPSAGISGVADAPFTIASSISRDTSSLVAIFRM